MPIDAAWRVLKEDGIDPEESAGIARRSGRPEDEIQANLKLCQNPVMGPNDCTESLPPENMCNACWNGERLHIAELEEMEPDNYVVEDEAHPSYTEDEYGNPTGYDREKWLHDSNWIGDYWKRHFNENEYIHHQFGKYPMGGE